jgi:hypothetical protein
MMSLEEESIELGEDFRRYWMVTKREDRVDVLLQRTATATVQYRPLSSGLTLDGIWNILLTAIDLSRQNTSPFTCSSLASSVNNPRIYCMGMDEIVDLGSRQICM